MKLVTVNEDPPARADAAQACGDDGLHPPATHRRIVRSFVRRAGRLTTGQARAIEQLAPQFLLPCRAELLDFSRVWGRVAPTVLEIGFGMGDATAQIAAAMPEVNFLGCEVHEPGVGALLRQIDERGLGNVRIVMHDAVEVIDAMLPAASLAGVHIYFPDPWHKKRHHKRRLVQPPLIARLVQRLQPGGYIHCATDWEPYAQQMLEVLGAEPQLQNTSTAPDGFVPRPAWRPQTRFESRGMRLGHGVRDLVFRKIQALPDQPSADAG